MSKSTPDPKSGYSTRWLGTSVTVFLPVHTRLKSMQADSQPLPDAALQHTYTALKGVVNRPLIQRSWLLAPQQAGQLTANYIVRRAATVDRSDGDMTYQVDLDPQDLVVPQSNAVTLKIPTGYRFGELPVRMGTEGLPHGPALRATTDRVELMEGPGPSRTDHGRSLSGPRSATISPSSRSRSRNGRTSPVTTSAGTA